MLWGFFEVVGIASQMEQYFSIPLFDILLYNLFMYACFTCLYFVFIVILGTKVPLEKTLLGNFVSLLSYA